MGHLVVDVKAEPKEKWHDPRANPSYAESVPLGQGKQYDVLDYSHLNNIVIWLNTRDAIDAGGEQTVAVNLNDPSSITAAGKNDAWQITNTTGSAKSLYVRSESGKVSNLGVVDAGATAKFLPREPGLNLLLSDSSESPLARIYVVPANVLRQQIRVVSEGKVTFLNLPPQTYTVSAWHERLPGASISVSLPPDKVTTAPLIFGVNSLPKAP